MSTLVSKLSEAYEKRLQERKNAADLIAREVCRLLHVSGSDLYMELYEMAAKNQNRVVVPMNNKCLNLVAGSWAILSLDSCNALMEEALVICSTAHPGLTVTFSAYPNPSLVFMWKRS